MADRISDLPDAILCHILSYISTKASVATSVLSKRWKPLWRFVPALKFYYDSYDYDIKHKKYSFAQSVFAFLLSRDLNQPLQKFSLGYRLSAEPANVINANIWLATAAQYKIQYLSFSPNDIAYYVPAAVFNCKTLVELELIRASLMLKPSSVNFPSLKILSLCNIHFDEFRDFVELLSGSPNLEELKVSDLWFRHYTTLNEATFRGLSKLTRAILGPSSFPLEIINNVQFLLIDRMNYLGLIPEFKRLTHIIFGEGVRGIKLLDVIKHCPKLQILTIYKGIFLAEAIEELCPESVPICISLHLRTCSIKKYVGSKNEVRFVRYVMQNARHLHTMRLNSYGWKDEKLEMLKELSSFSRCSPTCELLFT